MLAERLLDLAAEWDERCAQRCEFTREMLQRPRGQQEPPSEYNTTTTGAGQEQR